MNSKIFAFAVLFVLVGCKTKKHATAHFREGIFLETSKSFKFPRSVKQAIEKNYVAYVRANDTSNIDSDEKLLQNLPREFLSVDVFISQVADGTLRDDTVYHSPRGGGIIDLAPLVVGKKGSFFTRFEVRNLTGKETEGPPVTDYDVVFFSETKPREIEGKKFGSPCGSVLDIGKFVRTQSAKDGIKVNATDLRYLPVLGGTFYFVSYGLERVYFAAIKFVNSEHPEGECGVKAL